MLYAVFVYVEFQMEHPLVHWDGTVGQAFNSGDTVGDVQVPTAKGSENVSIADPASSTIVEDLPSTERGAPNVHGT